MPARQWLIVPCAALVAALELACASAGTPRPVAVPSQTPTAVSRLDPQGAVLAGTQDPPLAQPAADEPEGDEAAPGAEGAAIDAVGDLPVDEHAASPDTLARAVAEVEAESLDLAIEINAPVLACLDLYQGRLHDWFAEALSRGQRYLPRIREVFAEAGIPRDLAYVALVESAFKTSAYSRAKARGVWQFVGATGRRYGLAVDGWVDERSDPEKATLAAALYLKDLFELFGDWNLALAGYNAGEGKVLRAMARYGTDDFWRLRETRGLRPETRNYVPLIHAAILIAKAPERYGFTLDPDEAPEVEQVPVHGAVHLAVVARCSGETVDRIRALNPELRRLATPADRTFALRVPAGRAVAVAECLERRPPEERVTYAVHVVKRGQTLGAIARANGVTAREIADANGITVQKRLRVGSELIVPVPAASRVRRVRREVSRPSPGRSAAPSASAGGSRD